MIRLEPGTKLFFQVPLKEANSVALALVKWDKCGLRQLWHHLIYYLRKEGTGQALEFFIKQACEEAPNLSAWPLFFLRDLASGQLLVLDSYYLFLYKSKCCQKVV